MHEWFSRPLRFGVPQPSWEDIARAASVKTPLCSWRGPFYDALSGMTFKSIGDFMSIQKGDAEYRLFAVCKGEADFDHAIIFVGGQRRREIEAKIESLENRISELKQEIGDE